MIFIYLFLFISSLSYHWVYFVYFVSFVCINYCYCLPFQSFEVVQMEHVKYEQLAMRIKYLEHLVSYLSLSLSLSRTVNFFRFLTFFVQESCKIASFSIYLHTHTHTHTHTAQ